MNDLVTPLVTVALLAGLTWLWRRERRKSATLRRLRKLSASPGDRIGICVTCGDAPTHTHYGSLRSFTRRYADYDWKLTDEMRRMLVRHIEAAGFVAVELAREGAVRTDRAAWADLIRLRGSEWQVADFDSLREWREIGLKAVIIVTQGRVTAFHEGGGEYDPGVSYEADASGLLTTTRFFLWMRYFAVLACHWHVYWLDPPGDFVLVKPLSKTLQFPSVRLNSLMRPRDLTALTESELEPVRLKVLAFVDLVAAQAIGCLVAKRPGRAAQR